MPASHEVASRLEALSRTQIESLLTARPYQLGRQHDLHDLADTFLSPESITGTLRGLSRSTLLSLTAGAADEPSRTLMLAAENGTPYPEVVALLPAIAEVPPPAEPATGDNFASVALHTIAAARDLVDWVSVTPLPMGATGTLLRAEERELATGLVISEDDVRTLIALAERAGLVRTLDRRLYATTIGREVRHSFTDTWRALAAAVRSRFGQSLWHECSTVARLDDAFLNWALPALDERGETRRMELVRELQALGLSDGGTTALGTAFLAGDDAAVHTLLSGIVPQLESSVFVLDDLSVIAPGPLDETTDRVLGALTVIETRGLAPKRRLDTSVILRSLVNGTTAAELIDQLAAISRTPLSTAVTSTVMDIATNTRFVVLGGTDTDTAAKASHPELGQMLLTDPRVQRLAPVLVDDVTVLYGASRERVEATLTDCRYTVIVEPKPETTVDPAPAHPWGELAERLTDTGLGSTHLERSLITAGKRKTPVTLVVETSTGHKTITLEPRQVANGRVRGLDTAADVERTLPISAIIELRAAGE